ncbi:hypothetical protein ACH3XW_18290 [Acanthocheilonema viteae]
MGGIQRHNFATERSASLFSKKVCGFRYRSIHERFSGQEDSEDHFLLRGHDISILDIWPMLELYHDCDYENARCLKKFSNRMVSLAKVQN